MKEPKYIISIYGDNQWDNYFSITVADIDHDIIIENIVKRYNQEEFYKEIDNYVTQRYPDCIIIVDNNNLSLLRYLKYKYEPKLLKQKTILNNTIYGHTITKSVYDKIYLKEQQQNLFRDTWGMCNYFLMKAKGL